MRIENIRFKHHKVLGDTYINLCGKKRKLSHNKQLNNDDMIMELSNPSHNTFTYLFACGSILLIKSLSFPNTLCTHKFQFIGVFRQLHISSYLCIKNTKICASFIPTTSFIRSFPTS